MKKVIVSMIAVVALALAFVSCGNSGKNDNNNGESNDGNKAVEQEQGIAGSDDSDTDAVEQEQGIAGNWYYSDNIYYTFNEDGTGSYTFMGQVSGNFTYTEKDGQLILDYEGNTDPTVFNYKLDGNTLTILEGESNWGSDTEYKRK